MDNLTHALVGFVVAEAAARVRRRRGPIHASWAPAAYFTSALANNLPDLDFLYVGITEGKLGYLVHHRGHTHTLALALPLAALALLAGLLWLRRSGAAVTRADRGWLAAVALIGPVLHIAMDGSNNYGVHPFWPLYSGWVYGDTVFIIEPLFWATTLPLLIASVRSRLGRGIFALWLAATVILPWLTGFVPHLASAAVVLVAAAVSIATWRSAGDTRLSIALGSALGVLLLVVTGSVFARRTSHAIVARHFPSARTREIVVTPLPANPLCWGMLAIQTEGDRFIERSALLSLAPGLIPAARCVSDSRVTTAPLGAVPAPSSAQIEYRGQFSGSLDELRKLGRDHCVARELLRFTRAPFWLADGDDALVFGDLRYDRDPDLGFAELKLERSPARCPRFVPGWLPPRRDVLE